MLKYLDEVDPSDCSRRASGNADAAEVYVSGEDSNFALATIIWGNLATNVLLTLIGISLSRPWCLPFFDRRYQLTG